MLDRDCADVAVPIKVENRVLIEIARLDHRDIPETA
jgi:hypothetical protein